MAFKINVDKYSYAGIPEESRVSYGAELAKALVKKEAEAREAGDDALASRLAEAKNRILQNESWISSVESRILDVEAGKADIIHSHRASEVGAYTKAETDAALTGKSDIAHTHTTDDITHYSSLTGFGSSLTDFLDAKEDVIRDACDQIGYLAENLQTKADKTIISTDSYSTDINYEFWGMSGSEMRYMSEPMFLYLDFGDGEYSNDFTSGLTFSCGNTVPEVSYSSSGILNWVGTDCTTADGLSIFQPSANTHYDIVFYFNGTQFIGLVNGYVPASRNVVSA